MGLQGLLSNFISVVTVECTPSSKLDRLDGVTTSSGWPTQFRTRWAARGIGWVSTDSAMSNDMPPSYQMGVYEVCDLRSYYTVHVGSFSPTGKCTWRMYGRSLAWRINETNSWILFTYRTAVVTSVSTHALLDECRLERADAD